MLELLLLVAVTPLAGLASHVWLRGQEGIIAAIMLLASGASSIPSFRILPPG